MFKKIKYKIKENSLNSLIKISLFLNWPYLAAIAFWLASSKINPDCKSQYTVLCMGRSVFIDDLNAMATYSGSIKYIVIWRTYFQMVLRYFIKGPEEKKLTEENYHNSDFCKQGKQNYYLFLNKMFPRLHKFINFKAILCGNFGYQDQQELEKVCAEHKLPYIVLRKEGLVTPGAEKERADNLMVYKFRGAKILFYSGGVMEELRKNKFSDMAENQFEVVGMPRLDDYFRLPELQKNLEKQVIFFSFFPEYKFIWLINDEEKIKQTYKRIVDFHKWVMSFAKAHPDFKVIIKTKIADYYIKYVKDILDANFKEGIKNLEIINVGEVSDLIKNSTAVITFFSTTCIMAVAAGKMLITPFFGDLVVGKEWDYFDKYPELVHYAKTENNLEEYILNYDKYSVRDSVKKNEFLEKFLGNSDGKASFRAEEAIIRTIEWYKKI